MLPMNRLALFAIQLVLLLAMGIGNAQAQAVTVSGNQILRDGKPWVPKGINFKCMGAPAEHANVAVARAREQCKDLPKLLGAIEKLNIDTVRVALSQFGLDPKDPNGQFSQSYVEEIRTFVAALRDRKWVVILTMNVEPDAGTGDNRREVSDATYRAWTTLLPLLRHHPNVIIDIFNEPCCAGPAWVKNQGALANWMAEQGLRNALMIECPPAGQGGCRADAKLPKLPSNPVIYSIHPYPKTMLPATKATWDQKFGDFAETRPVMATEFLMSANFCYEPDGDEIIAQMFEYMKQKRIGVLIWGADVVGNLWEDDNLTVLTNYSKYKDKCGRYATYGPGELTKKYFAN